MDRRDYYKGQPVTQAELDAGFEGAERADHRLATDFGLVGIASGGVVSQHSPTADLTVDVTAIAVYDQQGQRVEFPTTQTVNLAVDSSSVSTSVATPGNTKIVSLFARFKRDQSDDRTDIDGNPIKFVQDEGYEFLILQGAESAGTPTPPALQSNGILLADITRSFGQTQIVNADIATTRREHAFALTAGSLAVAAGTPESSDQAILTHLNNHVTGAANKHPASAIDYAATGSPTWADGTAFAAGTVEAVITEIVNRVKATVSTGAGSGARKIGIEAYTNIVTLGAGTLLERLNTMVDAANLEIGVGANWADGTTNAAAVLATRVLSIISSLAGTSGAAKVGAAATNGFSVGSVRTQLDELAPAAAGTAFTAGKTFNGASGDTNAALLTTSTPTARKLLWDIKLTSTIKVRLYSRAAGSNFLKGFEISVNAGWNGSNWAADDTAAAAYLLAMFAGTPSSIYTGDDMQTRLFRKGTTSSAWAENAWDTPDLALTLGNPGATVNIPKNVMSPAHVAKAWGIVETDGAGNVSIVEGVGLASVTITSGDVVVTLKNAMASANYVTTPKSRTIAFPLTVPFNFSTTAFRIRFVDRAAGTQVDAATNALGMEFEVFGKQS